MTITAAARLILHRAAQARTGTDLLRVGDALGVDSDLPLPVYQARVTHRLWEMSLLAHSAPYVSGNGYRLSAN